MVAYRHLKTHNTVFELNCDDTFRNDRSCVNLSQRMICRSVYIYSIYISTTTGRNDTVVLSIFFFFFRNSANIFPRGTNARNRVAAPHPFVVHGI